MRNACWMPLLLALCLTLASPIAATAQYGDCVPDGELGEAPLEVPQGTTLYNMSAALDVKPFTDIFTLLVDPDVLAAWDTTGVIEFMNAVIDSNGGGSFLPLWNYFCIGDADTSWDGISILNGTSLATDSLYIELFNDDERGHADWKGIQLWIHEAFAPDSAQYIFSPVDVAYGRGFAHELGHVMQSANTHLSAGEWEGECNATAAEIISGHPPTVALFQTFHDVSFREWLCAPGCAVSYRRYLYWQAYLHGHFSGDPQDPTDDFYYGLVRSTYTGSIPVPDYTLFHNIGTYFENFAEVPGATGDERLGSAFQRAAIALHANEADTTSDFGFGGVADAAASALFTWWVPSSLHSRVIPPTFPVGANELTPLTTSVYDDPIDQSNKTEACARKPLGWRIWGTDYLAFTADPTFFSSHGDTLLKVRFESTAPLPDGARVRVGYIGYDSAQTPLQDQGIVTIEESVSTVEIVDGVLVAELLVPNFGHTVQAAVVVSTLVQDPISSWVPKCFDYSTSCWVTEGCSAPDVPYDLTYGYGGDQLFVPGAEWDGIQDAIDAAQPGQEVRVTETFSGYTESLTLRPGIPVLRALGSDSPVIRAANGASFAVTIPDTSDTATVLEGFVLEGGTSAVLRLEGPGTVRDCTIRSGAAGTAIGVSGSGGTGDLIDCVIDLRDASTATRGIDLGSSYITVTGCEIRTPSTSPASYAVTAYGGASTLSGCLVVGGDYGISLSDTSLVTACDIDSTARDGIRLNSAQARAEHCIVSNVLNPASYVGIRGVTGDPAVSYCIAPQGFLGCDTTACMVEDPLVCDPETRTLRADSYGNPNNNPSGELIGAFPVGCFGGTLYRDVTTDAVGLDFLGNITIPAGITLNLLPGATLRFPEDGFIHVGGTLSAIGSASLVSFKQVGGESSWQGIIVDSTEGCLLELEKCVIGGATTGISQLGGTATAEISLTDVNFLNPVTAAMRLMPDDAGEGAACSLERVSVRFTPTTTHGVVIGRSEGGTSYAVTVEDLEVIGSESASEVGLSLDTRGPDDLTDPAVTGLTLSGFTDGIGLVVGDCDPVVTGVVVGGCQTGIATSGLSAGTFVDLQFTNCDTALHLAGADTIRNCAVTQDGTSNDYLVGVWATGPCVLDSLDVNLRNGIGIALYGEGGLIDTATVSISEETATNTGIILDATLGVGSPPYSPAVARACLVTAPGGTGIRSGNGQATQCTVVESDTGFVYSDAAPTHCIAASCGTKGFVRSDGSQTATYCIADPASGFASGTDGTGCQTMYPLFCDAANGEYTLKADSYGNPLNNTSGQTIGAFSVACLYGQMVRNATIGVGSISVRGDAAIPPNTTLTLQAGAELVVDTTNVVTTGERVLIQVAGGTLAAAGSPGDSVVIRSVDANPGAWGGIRVTDPDSRVLLTQAAIRDAATCIGVGGYSCAPADSTFPIDTVLVANCWLEGFSENGIWLNHSEGHTGAGIRVADTVIDMQGATGSGIWVGRLDSEGDEGAGSLPGYVVTIENVTVTGNATGQRGVYVNDATSAEAAGSLLQEVFVTGLLTGTGIEIADLSATIVADSAMIIADCKYGLKLRGGGSIAVGQDSTLTITGCTTGIYAADSTDVDVQHVHISPTAAGVGVYMDEEASGWFEAVTVSGGGTAFKAFSDAPHTIRSCQFRDFNTYGVQVSFTGLPNLGEETSEADWGNNLITSSEAGVLKFVSAKTRLGELGPVMAEMNWWDEQGGTPSASMFSTGNVDYSPAHTSQFGMSSTRRKPGIAVVAPIVPSLAFGPNPFVGVGQITYSLPAGAGAYRLEMFDIQGRRVRVLDTGDAGAGFESRFVWDGLNDSGRQVAHGIYFLRLASPAYTHTVKIVRLP